MGQALPRMRIAVLGASPVLGTLIASYLRRQFKNAAVEACLSPADLDKDVDEPCAFLLIESSAIYSVHSIARAVARVRSSDPRAPIIVATASPNLAARAEALRCGAQAFVAHLAPISALADALRAVLAGDAWFPQTASQSKSRETAPALLQRSMRSPPRGRSEQPAHDPMLPPRAASGLSPFSVELFLLSGETAASYVGPCRRRATADCWTGPERRRAVAPQRRELTALR